MTRVRILTATLSLAVVLACPSLAGTEPNDANTPFVFEDSLVELPSPSLQRVPGVKSTWKGMVTYAAGVPLNFSEYFVYPGHAGEVRSLISFAMKRDISSDQRRFLETTWGGFDEDTSRVRERLDPPDWYVPSEYPNSPQILLYAVSLDDAKKMAEAYLRYAQDKFNSEVGEKQGEVERLSERLTDGQKRLPELIQSEEVTEKSLGEAKKQVPYRSVQQALDAAAELDKLLNTAHVEIAGIQARLKAIEAVPPNQPTAVASRLQMMRVEESISLQAAEARKRMAMELRKQADTYMDLTDAFAQITEQRESLARSMPVRSQMLRRAQQALSDLLQKEPKIIGNKVFLYPVKRPDMPVEN